MAIRLRGDDSWFGGVIRRFITFGIIGGVATIINYGIFAALFLNGINYVVSAATGYMAGVIFGFVFNKRITFKSDKKSAPTFTKYLLVYLLSLVLGLSILHILVDMWGLNPLLANLLVIGVTTLTNFSGCSLFVFNKSLVIPSIFKNPLFISVLLLKVILSIFLGGDIIHNDTIPFVSYFVNSGFLNPYQHFFNQGVHLFPYPLVMLIVMSSFRAIFAFLFVAAPGFAPFMNLLVTRIPLLIADCVILYVLSIFLKTREKWVLLLYWCSPILIYISYIHGQLDAIPVAFLFLSLLFLYHERLWLSSILLGAGIASKSHLFVVLPIFFLYLWKKRIGLTDVAKQVGAVIGTYLLFIIPFLGSKGFFNLVFLAKEQGRLFDVYIALLGDLKIFVVPAIFILLFINFATFKHISKDLYIMMITLVFSVLVIFVAPEPGWYFWSIPLIVLFLIKEGKRTHFLTYGLLNLAYLAYFLFRQDSDIFRVFQTVAPGIAGSPVPFEILMSYGLNSELIASVLFTVLAAILIIISYWTYQLGVSIHKQYRLGDSFAIGIAGDSGSGKTTIAGLLSAMFSEKNVTSVKGDDMHRWERHNKNWKKFTHLNPKSNKLHLDFKQARALKAGESVDRVMYSHETGQFTSPTKVSPTRFIIFEGLHQFFIPKMRDIYDLKIFMDIDESLRLNWKIVRDMDKRGYSKSKVLKQLKARKKDSSKYIKPQARFSDIYVKYIPEKKINLSKRVEKDVKFYVEMNLNIDVDLDRLGEKLQAYGVWFENEFHVEEDKQTIRFDGKLEADAVGKIAYELVPHLEILLGNSAPSWFGGKNGILQLVLLLNIDECFSMVKKDE